MPDYSVFMSHNLQDIVDPCPIAVYLLGHRCIDAALHYLTAGSGRIWRTGPVFVSERARSDRICRNSAICFTGITVGGRFSGVFRGIKTGKDARCSDAVFALCLAARPDVFLIWFTPKGYPPHVLGFPKEPSLPCLIRRSSMTRCTRDQLPIHIGFEKPIRICCCPQTFMFRFPSEDFFLHTPAPEGPLRIVLIRRP